MSSLPTRAFKAMKFFLASKLDASLPVACSNSLLAAKLVKSSCTLTLFLIWLSDSG